MNTRKRPLLFAVSALVLVAANASPAWATNPQGGHGAHGNHGQAHATTSTPPAASDLADGEVRRIDKAAGKVTLRHGEIRNLDMPPMTMVFQVREIALLDNVKVGDKVKFRAEKAGSGYVVTLIEPAK